MPLSPLRVPFSMLSCPICPFEAVDVLCILLGNHRLTFSCCIGIFNFWSYSGQVFETDPEVETSREGKGGERRGGGGGRRGRRGA